MLIFILIFIRTFILIFIFISIHISIPIVALIYTLISLYSFRERLKFHGSSLSLMGERHIFQQDSFKANAYSSCCVFSLIGALSFTTPERRALPFRFQASYSFLLHPIFNFSFGLVSSTVDEGRYLLAYQLQKFLTYCLKCTCQEYSYCNKNQHRDKVCVSVLLMEETIYSLLPANFCCQNHVVKSGHNDSFLSVRHRFGALV